MRFLHISNFSPEANSGAGGTVMSFSEAMRARGHDTELIWRGLQPFRLGPNFSRFLEVPRRQFAQAQNALARAAYDVVVVHQPHGHRIFSALAPKYPQTIFLNFSHGWELCDVKQLDRVAPSGPARWIKDKLSDHLARRDCGLAAANAHGIVVLNSEDAAFIREYHRVPAERVATVAPGLDPRLFGLPARPAPPPGTPPRVFFAGNYIYMKGIDLMEAAMLDAARANLDFQFTCVTHAYRHDSIRARLGPTLGARLRLENWLPRGELIELMQDHDIMLFPSRYEGFGKMAHEGMACGMAVVGGNVGALKDRAVHRVSALVSPPGDGPAFAANVREALTRPGLVASLGAAARDAVQQDTWEQAALRLENFVESCRARRLRSGSAS